MAEQELLQKSQAELVEALRNVKQNESVGDLLGLTPDKLESLYALGYGLYNGGKYEDALKVFRALCLYDSTDVRFWLGMGGCAEGLKMYTEASQAYAMGATVTGLKDPEPMYYLGLCCLKVNNKSGAKEAFEYLDLMGRDGNVRDLDFKERGRAILKVLKES